MLCHNSTSRMRHVRILGVYNTTPVCVEVNSRRHTIRLIRVISPHTLRESAITVLHFEQWRVMCGRVRASSAPALPPSTRRVNTLSSNSMLDQWDRVLLDARPAERSLNSGLERAAGPVPPLNGSGLRFVLSNTGVPGDVDVNMW